MKHVSSYLAGAASAFVLALLLTEGLPSPMPWDAVSALAAVVSGLAASAGLLFVGVQIAGRRLAHARFVNELARDIDQHSTTEQRLDRGQRWYGDGCDLTPEDMTQIEKYLNFFERVKYIHDARALDMRTIDGLFAYRFFHLVHNPNVQKQVLFDLEMKPYYRAIFELHADWLRYRQSRKLSVPRDDTPLVLPPSA